MSAGGGGQLAGQAPGAEVIRLAQAARPPEPVPAFPPPAPRARGGARRGHGVGRQLIGPLLAAVAAGMLTAPAGTPYEGAMLTFLGYAGAAHLLRGRLRHVNLLPLVGTLYRLAPVPLATAGLAAMMSVTGLPELSSGGLAVVGGIALLVALVTPDGPPRSGARAAVIGSSASAEMLARELAIAGVSSHQLVGAILPPGEDVAEIEAMPVLGGLDDLGPIVEKHRIDVLLMAGEAPRLAVFNELAGSCLHLPVRLWELSAFYEEVFGHVPVGEINASWFQYIMHPRYRTSGGRGKRTLDVIVAGMVGLAAAPLIGVLALVVRRDGGPALFRQVRIGEGGRPFTVLKLRTMRERTGDEALWASADDPRVTRFGRFLRRSHLDELPQVVNVLRGDMSLVGPRPEQPAFVERLERGIPFYSRRHVVKPGVTGWAQVRCGYAGSDFGSAWKLCHDLYYLKHRSFWLDLAILVETVRTLVADPQYDVEPSGVSFILRPAAGVDADGAPIAAV